VESQQQADRDARRHQAPARTQDEGMDRASARAERHSYGDLLALAGHGS